MKTIARVAVATLGFVGAVVLLTPGPAGAFGTAKAVAGPSTAAPTAHSSAPTSIDWIESALLTGQLTYNTGTTESVSGTAVNELQLSASGRVPFSVSLQLPSGVPIQAGGTIYDLQLGVNISVGGPSGPCNSNTGLAGVEVDQLQRNGSGNVTTAAMQFFCIGASGADYGGAMSFNLRPSTP